MCCTVMSCTSIRLYPKFENNPMRQYLYLLLLAPLLLDWGPAFSQKDIPPLSEADSLAMVQTNDYAVQMQHEEKYDSAVIFFQRSADRAWEARYYPHYVVMLQYISESYLFDEQPKLAKIYADSSLNEAKRLFGENDKNTAKGYYNLGRFYGYVGNFKTQLMNYEKSLEILLLTNGECHPDVGSTYNGIGFSYGKMGKPDKEIEYYEKALAVLEDYWGKDHLELSPILNNLGYALSREGEPKKSLKYHLKALNIRQLNLPPDHSDIALTYNNLGSTYTALGDMENAILYFEKSLAMRVKDGKYLNASAGWVLNNLGHCHQRKGEPEKALLYLQECVALWKEHLGEEHPNLGYPYRNLAATYSKLGQIEKEIEYGKKSLEIRKNAFGEMHPRVGMLYTSLGISIEKKGDFSQAYEYYQKSQKIALQTMDKFHPNLATILINYANHFGQQKKYDQALDSLQAGLAILSKGHTTSDLSSNPTLEEVSSPVFLLKGLALKARLIMKRYENQSQSMGDLKLAYNTYRYTDQLLDQVRTGFEQKGSKENLARSFMSTYEGGIHAALELFEQTGEENYFQQAFLFSEKNKANLLYEAIQEQKARLFANIPDSLLDKEIELREAIATVNKEIEDGQQLNNRIDSALIRKKKGKVFDLQQEQKQLITKLEKDYPEYQRIKYTVPSLSIPQLQAALPKDSDLVLEYFWGDSSLVVFGISKSQIQYQSFPLNETFVDTIETFVQMITDENYVDNEGNTSEALEKYQRYAGTLYSRLLANFIFPDCQRMVIIPDGLIGLVPFNVLLDPLKQTEEIQNYAAIRYLIQDHSFVYAHSAELLMEQEIRRNQAAEMYAGFAPAYNTQTLVASSRAGTFGEKWEEAEFAQLVHNQPEVTEIAKITGGNAFLSEKARESVFKSVAADYRILHLAMHTLINDENPLYSGLVFTEHDSVLREHTDSDDGFLHAYEIYNMHIPADLAVLSACQTGKGKLARGEGVMNLARAFSYAGCPSVVMSLWQADDAATRSIMRYFYTYLKNGESKSEALRHARLQFLSETDKKHPHYWAPFVLIGNDQPMTFSTTAYWQYFLIGLFILAIGMLGYRRYKE